MRTKERLQGIIQRLREVYPTAHCELDFQSPFQLLVATILSAQCTDKRVNIVTRDLFPKYPTAYELAAVGQEDLEGAIKTAGFYRSKAKNLRAMAKDLVEKHQGEVPRAMSRIDRTGRRRPEDGECRIRERIFDCGGNRGRHSCGSFIQSFRNNHPPGAGKNRAGSYAAGSEIAMDRF